MSTNNNKVTGEGSVTEPTQAEIYKKEISDFLKETGLQFSLEEDEKFVNFHYDLTRQNRLIIFMNKNIDGTINNYVVQLVPIFYVTFFCFNIESVDKSVFNEFASLVNYIIKNENE